MPESKPKSKYDDSLGVVRRCLADLPVYIDKYLFTLSPNVKKELSEEQIARHQRMQSDRMTDLGRCLLAAVEDSKASVKDERDRAVFANFAFHICRLADDMAGHYAVIGGLATKFASNASKASGNSGNAKTLYDFLLKNAVQDGYGYYGIGRRIASALRDLRKLSSIDGAPELCDQGSRILLRYMRKKISDH